MEITATQMKQNSSLLQKALAEDIVVTKRNRPFVVVVEYEKYRQLCTLAKQCEEEGKIRRLEKLWLESAKESESVMNDEDRKFYDVVNEQARESMERND